MSFGNKSQVHNHLSTKHPLFPHRVTQGNIQEKIVEPVHIEGRFAERAPPVEVEDSEIVHSHS
jgi:hypothetical protein